jgi:hypothetical protein
MDVEEKLLLGKKTMRRLGSHVNESVGSAVSDFARRQLEKFGWQAYVLSSVLPFRSPSLAHADYSITTHLSPSRASISTRPALPARSPFAPLTSPLPPPLHISPSNCSRFVP